MGKKRPGNLVRKTVLKRTKSKCFYCGNRATTIDHVIPLAHGGSNDPQNLVASCYTCNQALGSMVFPSREHKRAYALLMLDKTPVFMLQLSQEECAQ